MTIPGVPVPKQPPRVAFTYGRQVVYTPRKVRVWEAEVRRTVKADILWTPDPEGLLPFTDPVTVSLLFRLPMPKSWSAKRKAEMDGVLHSQTPDLDNLIKCTLDGLGDTYFADDAMVTSVMGGKVWAPPERAGVDIRIGPAVRWWDADLEEDET